MQLYINNCLSINRPLIISTNVYAVLLIQLSWHFKLPQRQKLLALSRTHSMLGVCWGTPCWRIFLPQRCWGKQSNEMDSVFCIQCFQGWRSWSPANRGKRGIISAALSSFKHLIAQNTNPINLLTIVSTVIKERCKLTISLQRPPANQGYAN